MQAAAGAATGGISAAARADPAKPAVITHQGKVTFGALEESHRRIAGLLRELGAARRDRVAVLSGNRVEALQVMVAALRAGVVPVPVSPLLTPREVGYMLADARPVALFSDRDAGLEAAASGLKVIALDDLGAAAAGAAEGQVAGHTLGRPMHYTSGTTGTPKGVWVEPCGPDEAAARSTRFAGEWGITSADVHLVCSPLTHSAPLRYSIRTLEAGGTVVLQDRFDAAATITRIESHGVTSTFMVPTHLERILALPEDERRADLSSMRMLAHAGAPIRESTKRRVLELFPPGSVWEFYGSTEGGFTMISPAEWVERPGSVGRAKPGAELIVTDDDREPLPPGEVGRVWVRDPGADRFQYWGDPAKTAEAWMDDAFSVGDLGHVDDEGYLFLAGRAGDTIISGGVNVYPKEIELVLMEHPAVREVVVYGVESPEWGQEVRARVVASEEVDPDRLRFWARQRLAGYKTPRSIELVDELPRTPTGKLKRRF